MNDHPKRPLYMMAKLTEAGQATLIRLCSMLDIVLTYSSDRWHSTFLPFGESSPELIDQIRAAMETFNGEPFCIVFDSVRGTTLQKRKGLMGPGHFQRLLAAHLRREGVWLPACDFDLHLNLKYQKPPPDRHLRIPEFDWLVEEIFLIESVYGEGRHIERGRWKLRRRQGEFDFLRLSA